MIFKTITDETTLSGQRIVGALQARKIAQQQATAQLEIDIACLKEYQVACQNGTVTTEQFDAIMHKASASAVEYSAKVKAGTGTAQSYANAQRATNSALQEVSIGAGIASKAVKLFSTALNMIAFTAIIQGISWLIGKVDEWIVTAKEAKESADAFKQSLSTFFNETQTNLKTISSLSDRFDELSKNVDDNGKKVDGTEEEYAEFLDICQQVGQIMPELITGYTAEGEAIITLQGKVDSLTDSYKEAIKAKAALFISKGDEEGNTIDSFFDDYNKFINGYKGLWDLKPSPSGQYSLEYFEEYYGYDKIHEWLSKVKDATLDELNNLEGELAPAQRGNLYLAKILSDSNFDINNITEENYNAIHDVLNNRFTVMEKELSDRVINIRSAFQNMLYADSDYWNIDDENVLSAINSLYGSIDAEFIKNNELFSQKALQTFESDFVSLFNNDATKQAMVDFYTPIADDETVKDYADRIKSSLKTVQLYCNENGITVPINFGDSEQTINDLETQYQRAIDFAKDKFDGYDPTAFFKEHSINTQEEIDAWQEIAQGARDAAEAEKEYLNQGLETEIKTFDQAWADSFTSENDEVKELGDILLDLAEKGRLTKEAFKEADSTAGDYFKNLGISADEAVSKVNKLVDESKQLSSMSDQISSMAEALGTKLEDGFVSADTLSGFDVEVRGLESWDRFQSVLGSTTSSYEECQEAANALATEWINSSDFLAQLTEQNEEYYRTQLKAMGIENYDEVISYAHSLNEAKEVLSQSSLELGNATYDEIEALIAEGQYSELTADMILALYDAKIAEQAVTLDTAADCENLIALAGDTDRTSRSIQLLIQLMNIYNQLESGAYENNAVVRGGALAAAVAIKSQLETIANGEVKNMEIEPTVKLGSKGKSDAKKSGKETADAYLEAFEKELEKLQGMRDRNEITEKEYLDRLRVA